MTNIDKPIFRHFVDKDLDDLLTCFRKNVPDYFGIEEEKDFLKFILHDRQYFFVAEVNKCIIGCCGVIIDKHTSDAKISWIFFHPRYRGKGIGKTLVSICEKEAENNGSTKIIARTSQVAYPFFKKMGYTLKFSDKDYWAPGLDLYFTEKPLK